MAPNAKRWVATRPLVGTCPCPSKMPLKCSLKFSMAMDRSLWKTRRTSTPSLCGDNVHIWWSRARDPLDHSSHAVQACCNGDHPGRNALRQGLLATVQEQVHASRNIGGSQHRCDGKPDSCDHRDDVQFPAIDESTASPRRVQWASESIEVWGSSPCSRCF